MAQGSGSAASSKALVLGLAFLCLLVCSDAAVYTVGDAVGWTFATSNWPRGKQFRAGDSLVFRYDPQVHNLVAVSAAGYNSCSAPRGSRTFTSGNDRITLARGTNYFICSIAGHCGAGMKVAVTAA